MRRQVTRRRLVLAAVRCTAWLLLRAALSSAYVQFEPVLVPTTEREKNSITCSSKVTYGRFERESVHKIARTTEDHNCILQGCQRIGEVLDIQRNNVSNFDRSTFGSANKGATKVRTIYLPILYDCNNAVCTALKAALKGFLKRILCVCRFRLTFLIIPVVVFFYKKKT